VEQSLPAIGFRVILSAFSYARSRYLHPIDPELLPGARNARIPMYGFFAGAKKSIAKRKTKANSAAAASTMPAQLSQFWK
jgi:hypothetical protein